MSRVSSILFPRVLFSVIMAVLAFIWFVSVRDSWNAYHGRGWKHVGTSELSLDNDTEYRGESPLNIRRTYTETLHFYSLDGETICISYPGRLRLRDGKIWLKREPLIDERIAREFGIHYPVYSKKHPVWCRLPLLFATLWFGIGFLLVFFGKRKDISGDLLPRRLGRAAPPTAESPEGRAPSRPTGGSGA